MAQPDPDKRARLAAAWRRHAMPGGGRLTIETQNVTVSEADARRHTSFRTGVHVMLALTDTGAGMGPEMLPHIFEPFFTTKERGTGMGLGLSTVYGIVKQSGGWVWVYSRPGEGTTFQIYLPRVEDIVADAEPPSETDPRRGSETLLVVEDEESVRKVTCTALRRYGYTVLEAATGGEALRVSEEYARPVRLLITDVVMPGMSGPRLATRLAQNHSEMKVLYTSGYTDAAGVRHGLLNATMSFLQKPFLLKDLASKVREMLDGGRSNLTSR